MEIETIDAGAIRRLEAADLAMVLEWRNHPSIRSAMFSSRIIGPEEHRGWFDRTSRDPHRCLLIVETDDGPTGFVQFDAVEPGGVSNWGFYVRPEAPRGSGRILGRAALEHAFGPLELHKVCGRAIVFNDASVRLHTHLGFRQEGVLREEHQIGAVYHSVLCFGLLRQEWQNARTVPASDPPPSHEE